MTKDRKTLLYFLAAASPIAFAVWQTLLNNYVVEVAGFTGRVILPNSDGHPVKRVTFAIEVNHDKKKNGNQEDEKTPPDGFQGRSIVSFRYGWGQGGRSSTGPSRIAVVRLAAKATKTIR